MTVATISTVSDLVRIVEREHTGSYIYRGQSDIDWQLLPTLSRKNGPCDIGRGEGELWRNKEKNILEDFRSFAAKYDLTKNTIELTDLELAILAQHYEAPTRLLDWTMNPLAALYFAVEEDNKEKNRDAVVWAYYQSLERLHEFNASYNQALNHICFDKQDEKVHIFIPSHTFSRAAVQSSVFAFWGNPNIPFNEVIEDKSALRKIIIPYKHREGMKWILYCLGINRETLFPGPDGLGRHLKWKHGKVHEDNYKNNSDSKPQTRD
ncbi:MAG: FRG domain-containing protein [Candidatus Schekmanbacteria bacterium]|nr:FRG domain-containing protein [Candidatus Schekmanbacteria bacterium]